MTKTILIAIDSATWDLIEPLIDEGELPTFSDLIKNGVRSSLKSLRGFKSPALWMSIATGKMPEKTGVIYFSNIFLDSKEFSFRKNLTSNLLINWPLRLGKKLSDLNYPSNHTLFLKKLYIYSMVKYGKVLEKFKLGGNYLITSDLLQEKPIWEILSDEKIFCAVIGWLVTWPAYKINGILVSERALESVKIAEETSEKFKIFGEGQSTYPSSIFDEISKYVLSPSLISREEMSRFFINLNGNDLEDIRKKTFDKNNQLQFFSQLYRTDVFSINSGIHIKNKYAPDFLAVYLPGLDGVQHFFWRYHDSEKFHFIEASKEEILKFSNTIKNYYKFLDQQIAKLIDGESNVIIVSDHGMDAIPRMNYDVRSIRSGQHEDSPDGIFIIKGKNIKKNVRITNAHILDIAPTLLYWLGKPICEDMDGKILTEVFEEDFLRSNPVQKKRYPKRKQTEGSDYSKEEEDKIKERLNALGYLD